jgi:hypothetical protein
MESQIREERKKDEKRLQENKKKNRRDRNLGSRLLIRIRIARLSKVGKQDED